MSVFLAITEEPRPEVDAAIKAHYPRNWQWNERVCAFVSDASAKEISEQIFTATGAKNSVMVIKVSADYFGYSSSAFWDWLKQSFSEDSNG